MCFSYLLFGVSYTEQSKWLTDWPGWLASWFFHNSWFAFRLWWLWWDEILFLSFLSSSSWSLLYNIIINIILIESPIHFPFHSSNKEARWWNWELPLKHHSKVYIFFLCHPPPSHRIQKHNIILLLIFGINVFMTHVIVGMTIKWEIETVLKENIT